MIHRFFNKLDSVNFNFYFQTTSDGHSGHLIGNLREKNIVNRFEPFGTGLDKLYGWVLNQGLEDATVQYDGYGMRLNR